MNKLCLCGCGKPVNNNYANYLFNHHQYHSDICSNCGGERKAKFSGGLCEKCYDRKKVEEAGTHKCACGCGELIPKIYKDGKPRLYKKCHNLKGENNVRWNGGVRIDKDGYRYILKPDHPFCDKAGYIPQHRLIYEHYLKIIFDDDIFISYPEFEIHHENLNVRDNSLINLKMVTKKEHKEEHYIDMSDRFCSDPRCKEPNKIIIDKQTGRPRWRKNTFEFIQGDWLHDYCFRRIKRKEEKNK